MNRRQEDEPEAKPEGRAEPARLPYRTDEVEAAFQRNYLRYQLLVVDFLAEHLADTSRAFGGDLQMAMLLAMIGQRHMELVVAGATADGPIEAPQLEQRGMATRRIADATGIPRETVRRKLAAMEKKGWLVRDGHYWSLATEDSVAVARHDLNSIDQRAVRRMARLFAGLAPLAGQRGS